MDVKCPVCEKLFPPSLITYHAEHCLCTSFNEKSNSSNKRSISEILEYESDVATATASYPRKRQHYGHSSIAPSTTASVAYYPKEPSDYRRVVSRQGPGTGSSSFGSSSSSSGVGASNLAPKDGTSWGSSVNLPLKPLKVSSSASVGSSSATGWSTRKPVSSQDYRSATRLPPRRDSSSNVTPPQRPYVRAPPSGPPLTSQRIPSLSSSAPSSCPAPSAPSAAVTHNYPKKGSSAPVAAVTVQRTRPARPLLAQPPPAAAAVATSSTTAGDGAAEKTTATVVKKAELTLPPRRLDRLYDLVRPCGLSEVVGHEAVLGPRGALRASLEAATFSNTIVWGPAGCGKSTLGHIVWRRCRQSGGSWRYHFLSGSAVATPELLQSLAAALTPSQGSKRCRTLLFVDELHCLAENVQVLLASSMDRDDITLIGTCHQQPASCVTSSLVSRCEVYRLQRLLPADLEVVVRRALGKVRCRVHNREAHGAEETPEQTRELDLKMIDGYYGVKKTAADAATSAEVLETKETTLEKNDVRGAEAASRVEAKDDHVKSESTIQPDNVQSTKNALTKAVVEATAAVAKKPANDNGIEDMSDEEDESILDVLTKDLDQIGSEFNKIDHEMDAFRDEDPRRRKHVLRDLNDLDCVSDDDLPGDQRHTADLESIDSSESEEQMEEEELSYASVGMTVGAVSYLSHRCAGDARVALDVLQSLLEQAKERAAAVKAEQARTKPDLPGPSSRQRYLRTPNSPKQAKGAAEKRQANRREAGTRIANYGSSSNNRLERRVVYEKESASLTTDDISSDEDNEVINARPESNGGTNGSRAKVDDLDNVSDVSDNSVHLDGGDSNATAMNSSAKQGSNSTKASAGKAMDSDDVLSDALSEEDALDYEEIDMGEDAVSDVECANTEKPIDPDDESMSGTSFGNVVIYNGRLSTMLFSKGREAIAPNKVSKSNLKVHKRPIKNKLLYNNSELMKNAVLPSSTTSQSSSPPKAMLGLEEIGDDLDDIPAPETKGEEDSLKTAQDGRVSSRQPGLAYAVITIRHVRQAMQHRGAGTPVEEHPLSAALVSSISSGLCEDALHCLARLLRAGLEPLEVASLLLQVAASHVGIGDSRCLSAAVACLEAVKGLPPPHSHAALATTAALLARAPKDPSPALSLQAAVERLGGGRRHRPLPHRGEAEFLVSEPTVCPATSQAEGSVALKREPPQDDKFQ